ncbi:hypothetical protein A3C60_02360 [Candidatus Nomurabacteria bacterium RIFCSPHIGHO2_02_FULL_37_45]|nr:MAG: hypothetical protein A3C60_02360 [Candidatus Nomurabacteria bacterium RIFCSPHIGHO2_02_FULL_37_45]
MEGGKRKILIVDDDHFLLDMYALKFSQSNFEVCVADSGMQALEKLKSGLIFDVILLDIIMPEMDGFEMLEIDKEMQGVILKSPTNGEIYKIARRKGMLMMREDAMMKSIEGVIPFTEVYSFSNENE